MGGAEGISRCGGAGRKTGPPGRTRKTAGAGLGGKWWRGEARAGAEGRGGPVNSAGEKPGAGMRGKAGAGADRKGSGHRAQPAAEGTRAGYQRAGGGGEEGLGQKNEGGVAGRGADGQTREENGIAPVLEKTGGDQGGDCRIKMRTRRRGNWGDKTRGQNCRARGPGESRVRSVGGGEVIRLEDKIGDLRRPGLRG